MTTYGKGVHKVSSQEKPCHYCGGVFLAQSHQAKYCTPLCKQRAKEARRKLNDVRDQARKLKQRRSRRRYYTKHGMRKFVQAIDYSEEDLEAKFNYWGNRCWLCGVGGKLTKDHVKPCARGGSDMLSNIRPACQSCNSSKSDKWPYTKKAPA